MADSLFDKIVGQLREFQPQLVAPYLNNEPMADKNIIARIRKLRDALPDTFIDIATNGTLLTAQYSADLTDPVLRIDEVKINIPSVDQTEYEALTKMNYSHTLSNVRQFIRAARANGFQGRYRIVMVDSQYPDRDTAFWNREGIEAKVYKKVSRGGLVPTGQMAKAEVNGCKYDREKNWLHILSNGQAVLCCMDWKRQHILGDLNVQSIYDVWNSPVYDRIRTIVAKSTDCTFICNTCEWGKST